MNAGDKEHFVAGDRRPPSLARKQVQAVELLRFWRREHDAAIGNRDGCVQPAAILIVCHLWAWTAAKAHAADSGEVSLRAY